MNISFIKSSIILSLVIFLLGPVYGVMCTYNSECSVEDFCRKADGDCGGTGVCEAKPTMCPPLWDPVCGCDGMTYDNDCGAAMAGVNVAYAGVCSPPECLDNDDCKPESYCEKIGGYCAGAGTCERRPETCLPQWRPVCGCDGMTYDNDCEAAAAGVNVAYAGVCSLPECLDNDDCIPGFYCEKIVGDCGGTGVCEAKPTMCPPLWDPVCGCDGMTYDNDCGAKMAGVNIAYAGECAVCVNRPLADISGDCKVSILDLAMLAAEWLDCGLDRPEICWQ